MESFKRIGKGRALPSRNITGRHGRSTFKFTFAKDVMINFERMEDAAGIYFRVYPADRTVEYDTCCLQDFERLFHINVEWGKPWPRT